MSLRLESAPYFHQVPHQESSYEAERMAPDLAVL
jgi:hypothetical protein